MNKLTKEEKEMSDSIAESEKNALAIYGESVNLGTEQISQEDINLPTLKIIQSNTTDITNKIDGYFYRSDTQEQLKEVEVTFVYVDKKEVDNYTATGKDQVRIYYGFYSNTKEPFRFFIRTKSWSIQAHRDFQSFVAMVKGKYKVPMFALTVRLSTTPQQGILPDSNKPYTVHRLLITPLRDEKGMPLIEKDSLRIGFLADSIQKFREVSAAMEQSFGDEINAK